MGMTKFGNTIKRLRIERNLTLADFSEKSGIPMAVLTFMEANKKAGSLQFHIGLANALDLDLSEFIEEYEKDRLGYDELKESSGIYFQEGNFDTR